MQFDMQQDMNQIYEHIDALEALVEHYQVQTDDLESELRALVEAIAARSVNRRGDSDSLYAYTAISFPVLWKRYNGGERYLDQRVLDEKEQ